MIGLLVAATVTLTQLPSLTGDFDHDGRPDAAALVRNGSAYQLVIRRGADRRQRVLLSLASPAHFYLGKAQRGVFATACGKGLAPGVTRCDHARVALRGDELAFGVREASDAVAVWKGDRFDLVWLTD